MKTRIFILVAITAIITLSFTFVNVKSKQSPTLVEKNTSEQQNTPVGGFALEESL